jgi:hypothetical protein
MGGTCSRIWKDVKCIQKRLLEKCGRIWEDNIKTDLSKRLLCSEGGRCSVVLVVMDCP